MSEKYTNISKKELKLLEELMATQGKIVTFAMIYNVLKSKDSRQGVKNFVSGLVKKGWLARIKRGVFAISSIAGRGNIELSPLVIAQILVQDSYVSFASSLQCHHIFDQHLRAVSSVSSKGNYRKVVHDISYNYIKAKKDLFNGWQKVMVDGRMIKVATKEKAILDFLIYRRSMSSIDLVMEKLKNYQAELNISQTIRLSRGCTLTVKRVLGLLLDLANIDSTSLYNEIKGNRNYSFMTKESRVFNAKWRLYYDQYFNRYYDEN